MWLVSVPDPGREIPKGALEIFPSYKSIFISPGGPAKEFQYRGLFGCFSINCFFSSQKITKLRL